MTSNSLFVSPDSDEPGATSPGLTPQGNDLKMLKRIDPLLSKAPLTPDVKRVLKDIAGMGILATMFLLCLKWLRNKFAMSIDDLLHLAAVAKRESGWNPIIRNTQKPGNTATGYWQVTANTRTHHAQSISYINLLKQFGATISRLWVQASAIEKIASNMFHARQLTQRVNAMFRWDESKAEWIYMPDAMAVKWPNLAAKRMRQLDETWPGWRKNKDYGRCCQYLLVNLYPNYFSAGDKNVKDLHVYTGKIEQDYKTFLAIRDGLHWERELMKVASPAELQNEIMTILPAVLARAGK